MEKYITGVLCMTVEDYDALYPGIKKQCDARSAAIVSGINEIDEATGLTKHQLGIEQAKITLSSIDKDGLSGYDKLGAKTKQTHMENVDEYGRNGYSQIATKAIVKGIQTKIDKGIYLPPEQQEIVVKFRYLVKHLSKKHYSAIAENFQIGKHGDGDNHIDHRYSIKDGTVNRVSPFVLASQHNLEAIPWRDNITKKGDSSISLDELLSLCGYTQLQSEKEFDLIYNELSSRIRNGSIFSIPEMLITLGFNCEADIS